MTKKREHWGSKIGFLMAAAGSAIGLGSLWRFPYVVSQNGGGAFVLLYILFVFFLVLPIFMSELIVGRKSQKSPVLAYSSLSHKSQNWRVAGWLNLICSFLILSFYSVVAGWAVNYVLMSLCNFTTGKSAAEISGTFDTLYFAPGMNLLWLFVFLALTCGVVYCGIRKGIEYWSEILMPALFVFLIGLVAYALTLKGAGAALTQIFSCDFGALKPSSILEALGMAFFTMSVGIGIIVTYGSYMKPDENIPQTSLLVAVMSVLVSLLAVLMIFPVIYTFNMEAAEGPGLVFKTLPVLFAQLPGTLVLSTIFFVLLVFTALTSSISLLEVLVAALMDMYDFSRKKATLLIGAATFIMGIPSALAGSGTLFPAWKTVYGMDFFSTLDTITGTWFMPIGGLLICIFTGWRMDQRVCEKEIRTGSKALWVFRPWRFMIRYIAPLAIISIMLQKAGILNIDRLFS